MGHVFLRVVEGPDSGREARADGQVVVGRGDGVEVVLGDRGVSRRHIMIRVDGTTAVIEDLGSSNGTYVNDDRIVEPRRVAEGDAIRIGSSTLELRVGSAESPDARGTATEILTPPDSQTTLS